MGELDAKVAVITGAARGIGRAAAHEFARQGAALVLADRKEEVHDVVAEVVAGGGRATGQTVDVSDSGDVRALMAAAVGEFGALDVLFNNAGITGRPAALVDQDEDAFDRILAVNIRGVFLGMKHALPLMISQRHGSIINTSSVTAIRATPGMAAYTASKHAIIGLTRVGAIEAGPHGVRVNALLPGPTATQMIGQEQFAADVPLGRVSEPEEQAAVACFLASDRSSFVNGDALLADGGMAWA